MRWTVARVMLVTLGMVLLSVPLGAEAEVGVTDTSIQMGAFVSQTGPLSLMYKQFLGQKMFYDLANEAGGVHGRKIEIVFEDDKGTVEGGLAAVKKLIYQHQVFAIHGCAASLICLAVKPEVERNGVPWMILGGTNDKITVPLVRTTFTQTMPASYEGVNLADFAMSIPRVKRVAIIAHQDEWAKGKLEPAVARLKEKYRVGPVAIEYIDRNVPDATTAVLRLRKSNPDVVLVIVYSRDGAIFLRDAHAQGLRVPFVANTSLSDFHYTIETAGGNPKVVKNLFVLTTLPPPSDPQMRKHWENFKKYQPDEKDRAWPLMGTGGANVVIEALRRAGPQLTREKFVAALESIRDFDPGIGNPISFSLTDHQGQTKGLFLTMKGNEVVTVGLTWKDVGE